MKPVDLRAYDAHPTLVANLIETVRRCSELPLEMMLATCTRMTLTGVYHQPGAERIDMPAEAIRQQRRLIEAAIVLRDTIRADLPAAPPLAES